MSLSTARSAFWHLRHGGISQVRTWRRRQRMQQGGVAVREDAELPEWPIPQRPPRRPDLRVAVVLDDFSRLALAPEWQQIEVTPAGWRTQVEGGVDLLFVESAWHGNGGTWRYQLTGSKAPSAELVALVEHCRSVGVPTVFWCKEDPVHFDDFVDTAAIFDHVLTTDVEMLPRYRERLGHDRVGVMPFAAQERIHNPIRPQQGHASRDIAFAGMYFAHKYPERREQMDLLLGAADRVSSRMEHGLEIFSRFAGGDANYQFPPPLDARVVGSLSYLQTLTAYRSFKVFLNVNSVVGSPSMCARRVFEISACGTPVVSTPSPALDAFFPDDEVVRVSEPKDAEWMLRALVRSPLLRDHMVHRAQRRIWREHTYAARIDDVLAQIGLQEHVRTSRTVTALVSTNRPHQLEHVIAQVGQQRDVRVQLALLMHGFDEETRVRSLAAEHGIEDLLVLHAEQEASLGACLNRLVDAATGDVVAKMDDDDLYGEYYLFDSLQALDYSGADVVGKQAHQMHLQQQGVHIVRFPEREHRFTDFVAGPTMVMPRPVALEHRFPDSQVGEDSELLRRVVDSGGRVYSADRFEFEQVRRGAGEHTWDASDAEMLANADVHGFGTIRRGRAR
ncbi:glycosyltransferase [Janibacter sp. Soil728]|uniref:glycosyltransferase family protein n=1 Tax=Janibacter sp. Soil728 TaxID=1736393 RepID=UPI0006FA1030|nr:glycosyltransferase [Janibacter sp. Soil728]KRE35518.1 glycosyltransferase [Janibacter sp. Soil728]